MEYTVLLWQYWVSLGFSRTIPEAMICGTPVIGTAITGTEDHVIHEYNGFLFPAHDILNLAKVLDFVIYNQTKLDLLSYNASSYARQNLMWTRIIEQIIIEVYTPLADF